MHENVERNMAGYEFADHISDFKKFMALAAYFSHTIVGGDGNSSISFCSELHYPRAVYSIHYTHYQRVPRTYSVGRERPRFRSIHTIILAKKTAENVRTERYFHRPENTINNKMDLCRMTLCIL